MNIVLKTAKAFKWLFLWIFRAAFIAAILGIVVVIAAGASHMMQGNVKSALFGMVVIIGLSATAAIFYLAQKALNGEHVWKSTKK